MRCLRSLAPLWALDKQAQFVLVLSQMPASKVCTGPICKGAARPASDFGKHAKQRHGLQPWCRRCKKVHALVSRYGVDEQWYQQKMAAQEGVCAICFDPRTQGKTLNVDHDHRTGAARGLLCTQCNTAFALIDANSQWLVAAENYRLKYLQSGGSSSTTPPTPGDSSST